MKKNFSIIGMITGILLVVVGILSMCEVFGDANAFGNHNYKYDSGYATFGADYYTYVVNNTAEIEDEVDAANSNLMDIAEYMQMAFGLFFICFGILAFCGFGIVLAGCKNPLIEENIDNKESIEILDPEETTEEN